MDYKFHHLGIPTDRVMPDERYNEEFRMYTSDNPGFFRVQFLRFEPDSPAPPLIRSLPHVALQVDDLMRAIEGEDLLLGPYEPISGYKIAFINDHGVPVELIETNLTAEELRARVER
jgi:hypothetical protein